MIIGIDEIHKRVKKERLIENLSDRELDNPEGTGIDLRIGKVFRLEGKAFLGIDKRDTPRATLLAEFDAHKRKQATFVLESGAYVLTETLEKLNMPADLLAILKPRTTLHRSGIITRMGIVDPGYSGTLHPGLYNAGSVPVTIEMGARYVNVFFLEIGGETSPYRGQWQGGRVVTDGPEEQI